MDYSEQYWIVIISRLSISLKGLIALHMFQMQVYHSPDNEDSPIGM